MAALALALSCLLQTPAEIDDLIGKLASESVEVRDDATLRLLDIGRPARRPLKKASESANPEVRARALSVLHEIDLMLVFGRGWRVTFAPDEYRVADLAAGIRAQTGVQVRFPDSVLEAKVRVDAKRALLWFFIDRVCEAHGGIRPTRDSRGRDLVVVSGKPSRAPVEYWGPFRTVIENLALERRNTQGTEAGQGVIQILTSWQPNVHPVGETLHGVSLHLDDIRLAGGDTLECKRLPAMPYPGYGSDGSSPRSRAGFFFFEAPPPGTKRLAGIRGHVLVHLPLAYETVTLGPRGGGGRTIAEAGGCAVELKEWSVKPGEARAVIELSMPAAGRANPETLPLSGRLQGSKEIEFLTPGGKPVAATVIRTASKVSDGKDLYELILSAETKVPPNGLRLNLLSDHFERRIDFEFTNVDLP